MVSTDPGVWLMAFIYIGYLSIIIKENPISRLVFETAVGASMGLWLLSALIRIESSVIEPLFAGNLLLVLVLIGGLLILFRATRRFGWVSRYPSSFLFGVGAGVAAAGAAYSMIATPIGASMFSFEGLGLADIFGSIVLLTGLVMGIIYFLFTVKGRGPLMTTRRIGYLFILFLLGTIVSDNHNWTISAFQTLLEDLLYKWLGLPRPV